MNIAQIEQNLQTVMKSFFKETFIYDFLLAYGSPKASIIRLQKATSPIKGGWRSLPEKEGANMLVNNPFFNWHTESFL